MRHVIGKVRRPRHCGNGGLAWTRGASMDSVRRVLRGLPIQTKLKVGAPNDAYEREADRVADRVMAMPEAAVSDGATPHGIQRACAACEEETLQRQLSEEEEEVQAKRRDGNRRPAIGPALGAQITGLRGGGKPLPAADRRFFEPRFGRDFGAVRIHSDRRAAEFARSINARAFTLGSDVVFAQGEYQPGSGRGRRLMAHELTHVMQQNGDSDQTAVQRQEPEEGLTPLQRLDQHLASPWTFDKTLLEDLKELSGTEKQVVLASASRRDQLVARLSKENVLQALSTLGANFDNKRHWDPWLEAASTNDSPLKIKPPGPDYKRSSPDGTLDPELENRMLEMSRFLVLTDRVTADISFNEGARSKAEAHIKSTTYHIIEKFVTLDDLKKLLAAPAKEKEETIHTAKAGDSLSLIAGYPNAGWRERLEQLIAANPDLPSIRDRSPDDPRFGWLEINDVINIPWETSEDGDSDKPAKREVRDLDKNLWYVEGWTEEQTHRQARQNRGLGEGEKVSLAYEGYETGTAERQPNSQKPPVSKHVHGLAIDASVLFTRAARYAPDSAPGWSVSEILNRFKLQRPIMEENNPYGPDEAEPWHFEKA